MRRFALPTRGALSPVDERELAAAISHAREDPDALAAFLEAVDEIILLNFGRELVLPADRPDVAHDTEEDGERREALLSVDHLVRRDRARARSDAFVSMGSRDILLLSHWLVNHLQVRPAKTGSAVKRSRFLSPRARRESANAVLIAVDVRSFTSTALSARTLSTRVVLADH